MLHKFWFLPYLWKYFSFSRTNKTSSTFFKGVVDSSVLLIIIIKHFHVLKGIFFYYNSVMSLRVGNYKF